MKELVTFQQEKIGLVVWSDSSPVAAGLDYFLKRIIMITIIRIPQTKRQKQAPAPAKYVKVQDALEYTLNMSIVLLHYF